MVLSSAERSNVELLYLSSFPIAVPPHLQPQRVAFYALLGVPDPHVAPFLAHNAQRMPAAAVAALVAAAPPVAAAAAAPAADVAAETSPADVGDAAAAAAAVGGAAAGAAGAVVSNPDEIELDL